MTEKTDVHDYDYIYDLQSYSKPSKVKVFTKEEIDAYIQEKIAKGEDPLPEPKTIKKRRKKFIFNK